MYSFQKKYFLIAFVFIVFTACQKQVSLQKSNFILTNDWQIISSAEIDSQPDKISSNGFDASKWHKASVPITVLAALVKGGIYKNPYFGRNLLQIPTEQFESPWWYRKEFRLDKEQVKKTVFLNFDGINYGANIWLNGKKIASDDSVAGAFRRFKFDVSGKLSDGINVLAVEVFPPHSGDFTIGFVDWNPRPPDNNMGLFRPVTLEFSGPVSINYPFVQSKVNLKTLKQAELTISAELRNHSSKQVIGKLSGSIGTVEFEKEVVLAPHEKKLVRFIPKEFKQLKIRNPRLWWPNGYGNPSLYKLQLKFGVNGEQSDQETVTFGIREISDYLNAKGQRGYKVNGKKILIKGGGWVDDLLLADTPEKLRAQVRYAKHINLNALRLEGFWGTSQMLYDLCDHYGIMIMVGWSCHWEWDEYLGKTCDEFGGIKTKKDMDLITKSWKDQLLWLRNHPSIFVWMGGSDKLPRPELEKRYLEILKKNDPDRGYLASAGGWNSKVSGPTGVKMNGPYAYTPPVYWYEDKENGGAFGFNTETGPGSQVPPLESIKKMIPSAHLWPIDYYWEYHSGRNNFNTLKRLQKALSQRYGKYAGVDAFAQKAQIMNYELIRPMFEAFRVNKAQATGIIQWMFNSAWPEMYWQLIDSYLMPNGAFYGTKKALEPLQLIYNYADKSIYAVNGSLKSFRDLKADISYWGIDSKLKWRESLTFEIEKNGVKKILPESVVKGAGLKDLGQVYFIKLKLYDSERRQIGSNFYWLSAKPDLLNYDKTEWYYTPVKQYADFTKLQELSKVEIQSSSTFIEKNGDQVLTVNLKNQTNVIAFFIELKVIGKKNGKSILPVYWDDNYISLLPGEERKIVATFSEKDLNGEKPAFKLAGWNVQGN